MSAGSGESLPREELLRLAVAVVLHDRAGLVRFAQAHGARAASDERVRETLLQCHLFCGMPRTIAAFDALKAAGLSLDQAMPREAAPEHRSEAGAELFARIYGEQTEAVLDHLGTLDRTLALWIAEHAYARVLSRDGLDAATRELIAVACLAATGHDRQLASHARGAIRCGAAPEDVAAVLETIRPTISPDRLTRARDVVARFARGE